MGRTLGISLIKIQYLAQALVITKESPRAVAAGLNKEPVTLSGHAWGRRSEREGELTPDPA